MHWIVFDFLFHMIFFERTTAHENDDNNNDDDKRAPMYRLLCCEDETQTFSLVGIFLLLQQQHKLCVTK